MNSNTTESLVFIRRLMRFYSVYSLIIGLSFIIIDSLDKTDILLATVNPTLFLLANTGYVVIATSFAFILQTRGIKDRTLIISLLWMDIFLMLLMIQSSGGVNHNTSNLALVPIIVANLISPNMLGYATAGWTAILTFYLQYVFNWDGDQKNFFASGMFGALAFLLAFFAQAISRRLAETVTLADEQSKNILRLRKISKRVLSNLPTGIIACDKNHQVLYYNRTALNWFPINEGECLPDTLLAHVKAANKSNLRSTVEFEHIMLNISVSNLYGSEQGDYLIVMENAHLVAAEAQQVKLASLGRLTASIAHEIRNPLSALRHASQLLSEDDQLDAANKKLTNIIEQHCLRINRTIEDILQISRRNQPSIETLKLKPWLDHFKDSFQSVHKEAFELTIDCRDNILIQFDPDQLQQILHSLCDNGLRYALKEHPKAAQLHIKASTTPKQTIIKVSDNGSGIPEENQQSIFEPFFTTEHTGTGLGLYLCKEICEANYASLRLVPAKQGTCFGIYSSNH